MATERVPDLLDGLFTTPAEDLSDILSLFDGAEQDPKNQLLPFPGVEALESLQQVPTTEGTCTLPVTLSVLNAALSPASVPGASNKRGMYL